MKKIDSINLSSVDLNLLIVFEALYLEQSVTRAGERIGLAQPSVSSALSRLRSIMNDDLFVRRSNRMIPTARAELLIQPISKSLFHARQALAREIPFDPGSPGERRFVIAVTDYSSIIVLPQLVSRIRQESPDLRFSIEPLDRSKVYRQFESREIDIAIGGHLSATRHLSSTRLMNERFVCITSGKEGRPWRRQQITAAEFLKAGHVMFRAHKTQPVKCAIDAALEISNEDRNIVAHVPHVSAIPFIVSQSDLVASIAERIALKFKDVVPLKIHELPVSNVNPFDVNFLCSSDIANDGGLQWMRDLAVSAMKSETGRKLPGVDVHDGPISSLNHAAPTRGSVASHW